MSEIEPTDFDYLFNDKFEVNSDEKIKGSFFTTKDKKKQILLPDKINKNESIHLISSANYSKDQRIENFTITNNEQLANFHKSWMHEIIGD